ncbi:hypothetical protein [Roseovarius amoyensis]|uniref:hypothetical protein n=1 Tax=Roseovarius amoyensis TaxID=2211448 RepID=UPI000DBE53B9|nr:hypothetical protein [Roseovarius amoyensis]
MSIDSAVLPALDDLLERERAALLSGRFDHLAPLLDEKARLIDRLNASGVDERATLDGLRHKAIRNQALFDGALQGVRRASDRITGLRQLHHAFETYDETGRRRLIGGETSGRMEKRV